MPPLTLALSRLRTGHLENSTSTASWPSQNAYCRAPRTSGPGVTRTATAVPRTALSGRNRVRRFRVDWNRRNCTGLQLLAGSRDWKCDFARRNGSRTYLSEPKAKVVCLTTGWSANERERAKVVDQTRASWNRLGPLGRRARRCRGDRQRFGGALNLNVHVPALVLDGVFARDERGRLRFHNAAALDSADVADVLAAVTPAIQRWLPRQGG